MLQSRHSTAHRSAGRRRLLVVEQLESRQLLASAGYQNPDKPLDVDNDQFIIGRDALVIVNRLNSGVDHQLVPLPPGQIPEFYYDTDDNGFVTANDLLQIVVRLNSRAGPPNLIAALANDTGPGGVPNADKITRDPSITGELIDPNEIVFFTALIDSLTPEKSIKNLLLPDGTFTLSQAALEQMLGAPLADGQYVVHFNAVNELGFPKTVSVQLELDRSISPTGTPDLPAASDTGVSNTDNLTKIAAPPITVAAELGALVTLFVDGAPLLQSIASPIGAAFSLTALADGPHELVAQSVDGAGNLSAPIAALNIEIHTAIPVVELIAVPFQDDLTPIFKATIGAAVPVADGEPIFLDIDRNNDDDYDDPDETATASATVFGGQASFQVTAPLSDPGPLNVQPIKLRVRVSDAAGNVGIDEKSQTVSHGTSNALKEYVEKDDGFYEFTEPEEILPRQTGFRAYTLLMTSQKWRTEAEVNKPLWQHWMTIVVPDVVLSDTALLNISGGDLTGDKPQYTPVELWLPAVATNSIVIDVPQVPSQPLIFPGDDYSDPEGRRANAIIAYSFDKFLTNPADTEWPALVAMVKAAVKGMNTAQTLVETDKFETLPTDFAIADFVVAGGGPWAWTAWLTAAVDNRVTALMPTLFESLNQDEQNVHHFGAYGFFADELKAYIDEGLFERALTPAGALLASIVDPYRYLDNGNFEIPKYLIQAAGDEFYVPDASQYYFDDLPGTQNYLYYVPNAGHVPLPFDAFFSNIAFYKAILGGEDLPEFSWEIEDDGSIRVTTIDKPLEVKLWKATNLADRDFRHAYTGFPWTSTTLFDQGGGVWEADVPKPVSGATAFYVELSYASGLVLNPGSDPVPFKFSTQVSVKTELSLSDWPFPVETSPVPAVVADGSATAESSLEGALQELAFAVAAAGQTETTEMVDWVFGQSR